MSAERRVGVNDSAGRREELLEVEDRPTACLCHASQAAVRVDGHRLADRFEERKIVECIRITGRQPKLEPVAGGEFAYCFCLVSAVAGAQRPSGEDAVDDLARRADRPVEAEVVGDMLHDFLQAR
jgi:hypothetical protein